MSELIFSIVTTAKNEKDGNLLEESLYNWEEAFYEKKFEIIFVDAGGNASIPQLRNLRIVGEDEYKDYMKKHYDVGIIKITDWDSPSIGRNLGYSKVNGKTTIFIDSDTLISTGTKSDSKYVNSSIDNYKNFPNVIEHAFRYKKIVGAIPSLRPRETRAIIPRICIKGQNYTDWLSTHLPVLTIGNVPIIGPSAPATCLPVRTDYLKKLCYEYKGVKIGPFDPTLAIGEEYILTRSLAKFGKFSYENKAGVFTRIRKRVSSGYEIPKSLILALSWLPYYLQIFEVISPGFTKYKKHSLSI